MPVENLTQRRTVRVVDWMRINFICLKAQRANANFNMEHGLPTIPRNLHFKLEHRFSVTIKESP